MEEIKKEIREMEEKFTPEWKRFLPIFFIITALLAGSVFGVVLYGKQYGQKVLPGVYIGEVSLSGMNRDDVKNYLDKMTDKLVTEGIRLTLKNENNKEIVIYPVQADENTTVELLKIDNEKSLERVMELGNSRSLFGRGWLALLGKMKMRVVHLELDVEANKEQIQNSLNDALGGYQNPPKDAQLVVESMDPWKVKVEPSQEGKVYPTDGLVGKITHAWAILALPSFTLEQKVEKPTITEQEVNQMAEQAQKVVFAGPVQFLYKDIYTQEDKKWELSVNKIAKMVNVVEKENGLNIVLDKDQVNNYFEKTIVPEVNIEAENARFSVGEGGKVQEFQGSRPGVKLDQEKTYTLLEEAFVDRVNTPTTTVVNLVVEEAQPDVKTGEVNNLGITDLLGVGTSNFAGSPANRIHNIRNAINKLNGILIKPGEEFSAIAYTQPYTIEGGYLPEKVIKGDEIIPEIGGGLCQVGTTLFRMAMNSGMQITERRNHSLVVSYYNDPQNNMPGTDATIYDPKPDFRFKNDTQNYILIQTSMNAKTGDLVFSLWGTKDGRKGSYTRPIVHNWIPAGAPRITETTKLAPGEKSCQNAFRGANTSFTYTRVLPDGQEEKTVFESHYRPLPQICLVGIAAPTAPASPAEPTAEVLAPAEVPAT